MPKRSETGFPSYCFHKSSGQALVCLNGRYIYLGKYGSPQSRANYDRKIAEWIAAGRRLPADPENPVTINRLTVAFRRHAKNYYRDASGNVSKALANFDEALKPLVKLYGDTPAAEFGPLKLKVVRDVMIAAGRVRSNINRHIARIRHVFRWAAENELIAPTVHHGLMAVAGLRAGRCGAKEGESVKPVPIEHVQAVLPHVSRQVKAMIELQLLTAMRPGEVTIMRGCDLDTAGKLWTYNPARHKTQLYGHKRTIYLGPKAQAIIAAFLKSDVQAYLFSPMDAERERRAKLHAQRKTPDSYGNNVGTNRRRRPERQPGEFYSVAAYYRAVIRGCDAAYPMPENLEDSEQIAQWRKDHRWHVHQLRHRAATDLRKQFGVEVSSVMLGHTKIETTEIYAEKNSELSQRVAMEVG